MSLGPGAQTSRTQLALLIAWGGKIPTVHEGWDNSTGARINREKLLKQTGPLLCRAPFPIRNFAYNPAEPSRER